MRKKLLVIPLVYRECRRGVVFQYEKFHIRNRFSFVANKQSFYNYCYFGHFFGVYFFMTNRFFIPHLLPFPERDIKRIQTLIIRTGRKPKMGFQLALQLALQGFRAKTL